MKEILLVNHSFPIKLKNDSPIIMDGISAQCLYVAEHLNGKYGITIVSPGREGDFTYKGIRFVHFGFQSDSQYKFGNLEFCYKLIDYCLKNRFHSLIVHSGLILPLSILSNFLPAHCVGYVHDTFQSQGSSFLNFLIDIFFRFSRGLDLVLSDNSYNCTVLREKYRFRPEKLHFIGNGTEIEKFAFQDEKDDQLIFIGRFVWSKNVIRLLDAFKLLLRRWGNLKLVIIGSGVLCGEICDHVGKNGLQGSVKVLTGVTDEQKIAELRKSKVYVSLSEAEGFGIPLVEGMACGTVPVVSNIEAHRFVLQGRKVGFLVGSGREMAEKVTYLLENEDIRRRMAGEGRKLVEEKWTWEKVAERYDRALSRLQEKRVPFLVQKISGPVKLALMKRAIRLAHFLLFRLHVLRIYNDGR